MRHAFTLIELLVVIAIVALLVGVLLPALAATREAAVEVKCQANLRSVHQSFHVFAVDHDQRVSIGHRGSTLQFNLNVYSGTSDIFVLYGHLYRAGLMETPDVFYCPAETNPDLSLNGSPDNPWPPGAPTRNTLVGYGLAPVGDAPIADASTPDDGSWPRLDLLGSQAILADSFGTPERVNTRHNDGVFALYADSGVQWVARDRFDADLAASPSISFAGAFNTEQQAIWDEINRR